MTKASHREAKSRYRIKVLKYYLPHIFAGLATTVGFGLIFSFAPGLIKTEGALNDYYSSNEVYQAAQPELAELDEQYNHGFANQQEYLEKLEGLKKKVASEFYKNDEDYQAILKENTQSKAAEYSGVALASLGSLTLFNLLCLYGTQKLEKARAEFNGEILKEQREKIADDKMFNNKKEVEQKQESKLKERSVEEILADLDRFLHK